MKIVLTKTGETVETEESYGIRLCEQGEAVPADPKAKRETKKRVAEG